MHALGRPHSWIAALGLARRPAEPARMQQCLLLAGLLHLWLVLLVGNTTGGTARPGDGVWGRLNITLQGPVNGSPDGDPAALPRNNGPRGSAPQERFGGAVRELAQTPAATTPPGAAQLGPWAPQALPPVSADARPAAPPEPPNPVSPPVPRAPVASVTPAAALEPAPLASPAPPAAAEVSVKALPEPVSEPAPSTAKLQAPANTVQRLSATALTATKSVVLTPAPAELQAPVLAPLSPAPTLKQFDAATASPALERVRPDAALLKARPTSPTIPSNALVPAATGQAAQALSALPQLPPLQHQLPKFEPKPVPSPQPMPVQVPVQALPAPAISPLLPAPPLTTPSPATTAPVAPSPAAADRPVAAAVPAPGADAVKPSTSQPLKAEPAPAAEPAGPNSISPSASVTTTPATPRLGSPSSASLSAKDGKPATSQAPSSSSPQQPSSGSVGLTGAPDAGSQLGRDLATPPSAASELPQAPARLNLSLPTRPRGGELSGRGSRGALDLLPTPPEQKSKLAQDLEKAGKQDCRQAYGGAGLLAVVPLALDAVRDKGCRW
ncbi:hypothetical protein [Roseateles sp. PN1]|uniref:hypothetical protein n=1 Tax=Roseateles sp. PN1 TaxID=3137372 RepID=UPI003138D7D1